MAFGFSHLTPQDNGQTDSSPSVYPPAPPPTLPAPQPASCIILIQSASHLQSSASRRWLPKLKTRLCQRRVLFPRFSVGVCTSVVDVTHEDFLLLVLCRRPASSSSFFFFFSFFFWSFFFFFFGLFVVVVVVFVYTEVYVHTEDVRGCNGRINDRKFE